MAVVVMGHLYHLWGQSMGTVKVFAHLGYREGPKAISPLGAPVPCWEGWGDDGCFVLGWKSYGLVVGVCPTWQYWGCTVKACIIFPP